MPAIDSLFPATAPPVQPLTPISAAGTAFDFTTVFGGVGNPVAGNGKTLPEADARGPVKAGKQPAPAVLPRHPDARDETAASFATDRDTLHEGDTASDPLATSADDAAPVSADAAPYVVTPILGTTWIVPKAQVTGTAIRPRVDAVPVQPNVQADPQASERVPGECRHPVTTQPVTEPWPSPAKRQERGSNVPGETLTVDPAFATPPTFAAPPSVPTPASAGVQLRAAALARPAARLNGSTTSVECIPSSQRVGVDPALTPPTDAPVSGTHTVDRRTVSVDPQPRTAWDPLANATNPTPEAEKRAVNGTAFSAILDDTAPSMVGTTPVKFFTIAAPIVQSAARSPARKDDVVSFPQRLAAVGATPQATSVQPTVAPSLRSGAIVASGAAPSGLTPGPVPLPGVAAPRRIVAPATLPVTTAADAPMQVSATASIIASTSAAPALVSLAQTPAVPAQPAIVANASKLAEQPAPTPLAVQSTTAAQPTAPDTAALLVARPASTSRTIVAAPAITQPADRADTPAAPLAPPVPTSPVHDIAQPPVDTTRQTWPTQMVDRIERLRDAADAVSTSIRLIPDALGAIDVSVRKEGEVAHVHLAAEQQQTRALLADAQPKLAELAEQRGVKLGQTEVGGGSGNRGQSAPQQHSMHQPSAPVRAARADTALPDDTRIA